MTKPMLHLMSGKIASGKSTLAKSLASPWMLLPITQNTIDLARAYALPQ
jgi:deoxyadenosine/deoxycytidine kinase